MNIQFTQEQLALRDELRAYFKDLMTPELQAECERDMGEGGGPLWREALQKMGRDGWIGVGWPSEWGGSSTTSWMASINCFFATVSCACARAPNAMLISSPWKTLSSMAGTPLIRVPLEEP